MIVRHACVALVLLAALTTQPPPAPAADAPDLKAKAKAAMDKAVAFLKAQQKPDGSFGEIPNVGHTAIVLAALTEAGYKTSEGDVLAKAAAFIASQQQKEGASKGAIYGPQQSAWANYMTCLSISALSAYDKEKYKDVIAAAVAYERGIQEKKGAYEGGVRYGTDDLEKADLSNSSFFVQAFHDAGIGPEDEAMKRAMMFVSRMQNRSESDIGQFHLKTEDGKEIKPGTDGSFQYAVQESKAGFTANPDGTVTPKGYGSMSVTGLKSLLFAGAKKDDPRVVAVVDWIRKNWELAENPGLRTEGKPASGQEGLFYYYINFAKAFDAYGEATIVDASGAKHAWSRELAEKLLSLQKEDGSWFNKDADRWEEGNPVLVTGYVLQSLAAASRWLDKE